MEPEPSVQSLIIIFLSSGAIMFNDIMTQRKCAKLLQQLRKAKNPFACVHGRPSLVTLAEINPL